jgi:hypothetical protein
MDLATHAGVTPWPKSQSVPTLEGPYGNAEDRRRGMPIDPFGDRLRLLHRQLIRFKGSIQTIIAHCDLPQMQGFQELQF